MIGTLVLGMLRLSLADDIHSKAAMPSENVQLPPAVQVELADEASDRHPLLAPATDAASEKNSPLSSDHPHAELEEVPPPELIHLAEPASTRQDTLYQMPIHFPPLAIHVRNYIEAGGAEAPERPSPAPVDAEPWWRRAATSPQAALDQPVVLDRLILDALTHSPHIQAIRSSIGIRNTYVAEELAAFDPNAFMETRFIRTSDPVGDLLTTNAAQSRYRDQNWNLQGGLRRRTQRGGTLEMSQRIGYRDNNSDFLQPKQQGTSRLVLGYTQPLLNGAGRPYNRSQIVLASIDTRVAQNEVAAKLTTHLLEVTTSYWDLYLRRAALMQNERNYVRGRDVLKRLEDRKQVDSLRTQILAAEAAVSARRVRLIRAETAIRNAESRLRALVGAPDLYVTGGTALIPVEAPMVNLLPITVPDALVTALHSRPEVEVAIQKTRAASVRLNVSQHEMLPVLNMVLETYVSGLQGQGNIGQSLIDQFSVGEPSYTAGLQFNVPLHRRVARARLQRQRLELGQATAEFRGAVQMLVAEIEIAVREVDTSYREIVSQHRSLLARKSQVDYLTDRWKLLPGNDRNGSLFLEELLKAQDQLADAEYALAQAEYKYALSHVKLKQTMGTLLTTESPHPPPNGR